MLRELTGKAIFVLFQDICFYLRQSDADGGLVSRGCIERTDSLCPEGRSLFCNGLSYLLPELSPVTMEQLVLTG